MNHPNASAATNATSASPSAESSTSTPTATHRSSTPRSASTPPSSLSSSNAQPASKAGGPTPDPSWCAQSAPDTTTIVLRGISANAYLNGKPFQITEWIHHWQGATLHIEFTAEEQQA